MKKNTSAKPFERSAFLKTAVERAEAARLYDRTNIEAALFDLNFRAGLNQWPESIRQKREAAGQPCLVINRIPQFVRQVTGEIRQMKPALKAYRTDAGDAKTAETVTSMLRFIEAKSDAGDAYYKAVDSQVAAGLGHWRISTQYCDDDTDNQDIVISSVDDQINVLWDPDATKSCRQDAKWCHLPVDMTLDAFKAEYPDAKVSGFDSLDSYRSAIGDTQSEWWCSSDIIRVSEYWERVTEKVGNRRVVKVYRSIITSHEVLEERKEWPGQYIPIVPLIGEEVRIGNMIVRSGMVRFLRDPQMRLNYWISAQTEYVALQPKSPFLVTDKQVADHVAVWSKANEENLPYLVYTPDPLAPPPSRAQPPVASSGFSDGVAQAVEDMKAVTGQYDASLGARSNETSGVAIQAREQAGDVGTYVYVDNFQRSMMHSGNIIVDLIPKIYDTQRTLRIIGEDGAMDEIEINKPYNGVLMEGESAASDTDVTIGRHAVVVQMGPSHVSKRQEAQTGMLAWVQAFPPAAPLLADMMASMQDWPMADKISERMKTLLPPEIRAKEEAEAGAKNGQPVQPPQMAGPPPEVIAQMQAQQAAMQAEQMKAQMDLDGKQIELEKRRIDLDAARQASELKIAEMHAAAASKAEQVKLDLMAQEAKLMSELVLRQQAPVAASNDAESDPQPDQSVIAIQAGLEAVRDMMEQVAMGQEAMVSALTAAKQVRVERQPDGSMIGQMQPVFQQGM